MTVVAELENDRNLESPDLERLKRAAQGSEPDLERLYTDHVDGLYAFVYYRVGQDVSLAEDVVQETFTQALDRIADYDAERGSVRAWLRVLSRNIIRDHLRGHRRGPGLAARWQQVGATMAQVFGSMDREPLSDEVLDQAETRQLVNMALADLPAHYRTVLQMRYVHGRSTEEMSWELEQGKEAVKSSLARARRAFKKTFVALLRSMAEVDR